MELKRVIKNVLNSSIASVHLVVCSLLFLLLLLPNEQVHAAKRFALVIGNDNYSTLPSLNNARKDAQDVSSKLKRLGFEVTTRLDISQRDLFRVVDQFSTNLSAGDTALIFYAGHGISVQGTNYLIPSDAQVEVESDLRAEAFRADEFLSAMSRSGADLSILILDACRDNPLPTRQRSISRGLKVLDVPQSSGGSVILYSAAEGQVAEDGEPGKNGVFTSALLKNMEQPGLTIFEVFSRTAADVSRQTGNKQKPWLNASYTGKFYLSDPNPISARPAQAVATGNAIQIELAFWNSVANSEDIAQYQAYLGQFPDGNFAQLAKLKIKALDSASVATPAVADSVAVAPSVTAPPVKASIDLYVNAQPSDVRVRILNIGPKFYQGISLQPGRYKMEVSKPGYKTSIAWFELSAANTEYRVKLQQVELKTATAPASISIAPRMVSIPAGSFRMGDQSGDADERPTHTVQIPAFEMSRTEITFGQWDACVADGGCRYRPDDKGQGRANRPVVNVSWGDIYQQYIPWLNRRTGKVYRLPSEAEWEYAARAGTRTAYPWGDIFDPKAANGSGTRDWDRWAYTAPVRSYKPNAWGLYDMHGNAFEWTQDCWNNNYQGAPKTERAQTTGDCSKRVLRGGSVLNRDRDLRSSNRSKASKTKRYSLGGFRLARTL